MEDEELKSIVQRMVDAGESEDNIALVIQNYKPSTQTTAQPADESIFQRLQRTNSQQLQKMVPQGTSPLDIPELIAGGTVNTLITSPVKMVGALDEVIGNTYMDNYQSPATRFGKTLENFFKPDVSDETANSLSGQVASGLGTGLAFLGSGGVSALSEASALSKAPSLLQTVKGAFTSPTAVLGGAVTAVPEYEAAKAAGLPEDELFGVLAKNYLVGQTEALPIQNLFGRLNKLTGGTPYKKLLQIGAASGMGAFEESVQEGTQTYLSNEIAKGSYDPDRDPFWGLARAMTVGGIVGAILPGVGAAMTNAPASEKPKIEKKVRELQSLQQAVQTINSALEDGQIGNGIDEQIEQASQVKEEAVETVDTKNEAELSIAKAEDDQKLAEQKAKEAEKETNGEPTSESVSETGAGGDTSTSDGVLEESPEYKAANEAYQVELAKLKQSPNVEVTPNGVKPLNDEGVQEAKNFTASWQNRDNARIADLKRPTTRQKATVKMTPGQALKSQVQTFYRGIAKGVKKGSELKSELLTKVQEAIKEYPLSPKQVSTILTRVKNTNLFTPGSVSRLNDYVSKVADDATFAEKYEQAYGLRKKIKGKRASSGLSHSEKTALKQFTAVDPDYVDIDQYLEQAGRVHDTLLRPIKERTALDTKSIADYVATTPDTNALREQERQERFGDEFGLDFEAAATLLENEPETNNKEKLRGELIDVAEQAKNGLIDKWGSGDVEGSTKGEYKDLQDLMDIDTSLLSPTDLREYVRTIDRITNNGDYAGSGNLAAKSRAQKDFKKLLELSKNWNILNINNLEVGVESLPVLLRTLTGLDTAAAEFQRLLGITDIGRSSVDAVTQESDLVKLINTAAKKFKKGTTNDSILRQGIYGELIAYEEGTDSNEALQENKKLIEESIATHKKNGESKEAANIERLYAPFKNTLTVDDVQRVMKQTDPDGYEIIGVIQKFFEKHADQVVDYNNRYHNSATNKVINYTGRRKWRNGGEGLSTDDYIRDLDLSAGIPTDYRLRKLGQTASAKDRTGYKRDNAVLDFNKHQNALNGLKRAVFDMGATDAVIRLVEASKRKEMAQVLGAKEGEDDSIQKANELKKKLFGKDGAVTSFLNHSANKVVPDETEQTVRTILNNLRKFGYTLSLSGITQIPKQATVLANTAIQLGGDAGLMISSIGDAVRQGGDIKELIKGETISMRGLQKSDYNLGEVVNEKQLSESTKTLDKWLNKSFEGWLGIAPLIKTDVKVAEITWLAFYKQYLKDNDIEYKGLKEENSLRDTEERQKARAYAKQKTDVLQVTSNPTELGKWIKAKSVGAQMTKAALLPFGTFSANSKARLWGDYKTLTTGNAEQKKAAARSIAGTFVESVTFNAVSLALKAYIFSILGSYLLSVFDVPEDRDRDKKTWDSAVGSAMTNVVADALPILMTDPGEQFLSLAVNQVAKRWFDYDKKIAYRYAAPENDIVGKAVETLGPYGVPIDRLGDFGQLVFQASSGTKDGKKLTEEQRRLSATALLLYSLHLGGMMPADVINLINKEYSQQKPGRHRRQAPQQIEYLK